MNNETKNLRKLDFFLNFENLIFMQNINMLKAKSVYY